MAGMRRWRRYMLFLEAFVVFHLTDLALRRTSYRRVIQWLARGPHARADVDPCSETAILEAVVGAVELVRRFDYRLREDCLPRALTLQFLLSRRGIRSTFRMGVRQFPFAAHAWVEHRGRIVGDLAARVGRYTPLTTSVTPHSPRVP